MSAGIPLGTPKQNRLAHPSPDSLKRWPLQMPGPLRLACALAVVSSIFYGFWWQDVPVRAADTSGYLAVAENLGMGLFSAPQGRTPGYPILLWLTGLPPSRTIVWVGLGFHATATIVGAWLLSQLGLPRLWQLIFAVLLSLPLYTQSAGILLTENSAEFSLVMAFLCWWLSVNRSSLLLGMLSGLLAAWAALIRPAYQLLPLLLVGASFLFVVLPGRRKGSGSGALLACVAPATGILLLLVPMTWNYLRHGYFGLTHMLGGNLCNRTALYVERAGPYWEPLRSALINARNDALIHGKSHTALQYQWDHWSELRQVTGLDDVRLAHTLARLNFELIVQNPLNYLSAVGAAMVSSLFPYVTEVAGNSGLRQLLWTAVHFLVLGAWIFQLWLIGGSLLLRALRKSEKDNEHAGAGSAALFPALPVTSAYWGAFLIVAYTILINSMFDVGDARQRSPVDWFIVFQTFIGLCLLIQATGRKGRSTPDAPVQ